MNQLGRLFLVLLAAALAVAGAISGCTGTVEEFAVPDAAATADSGAEQDSGTEDAGDDAGGVDAGEDSGTIDAGQDAGRDAGLDAGRDAGLDAGLDAGTDGGVPGYDGGVVSYAAQLQPIWNAKCGTTCHLAATPTAGLSLAGPPSNSFANLDNQNTNCNTTGGVKRVVPNNLDRSELWLKISNDPARCLAPMPLNQLPLTPLEQVLIRQWILQGANNN
jgi:hypothetical protein